MYTKEALAMLNNIFETLLSIYLARLMGQQALNLELKRLIHWHCLQEIPNAPASTPAADVGIGTSAPAYILETYQGGSGGVVVGASLAASGNGGAGRGVGLMFKAPGSANSVEVARIDGRQNTANGTANAATLNFMVANTSGTLTERLTIDSSGRVGIGTIYACHVFAFTRRKHTG
jgi:hypothetical protein